MLQVGAVEIKIGRKIDLMILWRGVRHRWAKIAADIWRQMHTQIELETLNGINPLRDLGVAERML
jgi:hypothetical protein